MKEDCRWIPKKDMPRETAAFVEEEMKVAFQEKAAPKKDVWGGGC